MLLQVSQTPHEILFLNILQHLLQIDSRETVGDYIWETAEKLVCRTKLLESKEEAEKLLRLHTGYSEIHCHCLCHRNEKGSSITDDKAIPEIPLRSNDTRPPTPPPLPPPAFLRKFSNNSNPPTKDPKDVPFAELISRAIKINKSSKKFASENGVEDVVTKHPVADQQGHIIQDQAKLQTQHSTNVHIHPLTIGAKPKQKLKTFPWNKVPVAKVVSNRDNIWMKATGIFTDDFTLDLEVLEELFCQTSPPNTMERKTSSSMSSDRKKRDSNEINLLDPKRSLNVNIFLRQFRG